MKRLIEREFPPQSLEADGRALLEAMSPAAPAPGMKARVRARLLATPVANTGMRLRVGLVLAFVLVASLAAAATTFVLRRKPPHVVSTRPTPLPATARTSAEMVQPSAPPSASATLETPAVSAPVVAPANPHSPVRTSAKSQDESSEANLLFEAARALRHEGNPGRAAELLAEYRKEFPRGALAEEALALSIDVAVARGDARAAKLARRYLELYPGGHFADKAKRALGTGAE